MAPDATTILENPALLAALTGAIIVLVHYQRGLSYREVVGLQWLTTLVFPAVNAKAAERGRPLIREKGPAGEDPDYVETLPVGPREVIRELRPPFEPQLLSTAKYRTGENGGREWIHSQWVYYHDDGHQTHVYLFTNGGETDVYAHVEPAVTVPTEHHLGDQQPGDARGAYRSALSGE